MPFENIRAGIALLLDQMTHTPEDSQDIQNSLREKLTKLRGFGLPLANARNAGARARMEGGTHIGNIVLGVGGES